MATDAEIRAWARENGATDVPSRGPVPPALRASWELEHPFGPEPEPGDDDFPGAGFDESAAGPPPADAEKRPRTITTPGVVARARSWGKKPGPAGKKKGRPRVPVDGLIAALWRGAAGLARPLPPTSRLLKLQAPVAGVILEDVVKGTVVDRILQPLARTSRSAEAVFALAGPPVLVTVMQLRPDAAPLIVPLLRESLLAWGKIAGPKMGEAMKREEDFAAEIGQPVDDLIAFLFAEPADAQAEDQAVRSQQEAMAS